LQQPFGGDTGALLFHHFGSRSRAGRHWGDCVLAAGSSQSRLTAIPDVRNITPAIRFEVQPLRRSLVGGVAPDT